MRRVTALELHRRAMTLMPHDSRVLLPAIIQSRGRAHCPLATVKIEAGAIECLRNSTKDMSESIDRISQGFDALKLDLEADEVTIDQYADGVVVKYEYVIVDAEKQTTRCVVSTGLWEW